MSKKNKITVKELKETISDSDDNARLLFSFDDEDENSTLMELVSISKSITLTWDERKSDVNTILHFSLKKRKKKGGK